ncbi:efflux RND transporter permease subunit [Roseimaritima ulvae]|uniref:Multidrug efflux system subunit MdtC n=1 Tax=Roseimaritima ulvae TaxID=980254 RepID=A0A5B9QT52_9BACT|nr:MMPL family transporter [Roseimaritima ulvae]QEG40256.1 multidrug efflux system subunit MdtC [Roseimaritima ulvae]
MLRSTRSAGWLILLLSVAAAAGMLRLDYQDNPRDLYLRSGPESDLLEHVYEAFGSDDNTVMIVVDAGAPIFSLEVLQPLSEVVAGLEELDEIDRVSSLFSLRQQRRPIPLLDRDDLTARRIAGAADAAEKHPLARGILLSESGQATMIVARLAGQSLSVAEMKVTLGKIDRLLQPLRNSGEMKLYVAGPPVIRVESLDRLRIEQAKFSTVGLLAALALAIYVFRQWQAVALGLIGPTLGVLWTFGAMGWLGQRIDGIKIIIPTLLFVIGFTDSLHLVMGLGRIQRAHGFGLRTIDAARRTLAELGGACFMTSLTTAIGFGSLMLSGTTSIQRFGFCCAIGAMLLYAAVILTFFWLASGPFGLRVAYARPFAAEVRQHHGLLDAAASCLRYPKTIVTVALLGCGVMAWYCGRLEPNIYWTESVSRSSSTLPAMEEIERQFGGSTYGSVLVRWPAGDTVASPNVIRAMAATHQAITAEPQFGAPLSIANVLASMDYVRGGYGKRWQTFRNMAARNEEIAAARLVDESRREAIIYFLTSDVGANAMESIVQRVAGKLAEAEAETGVELTLGGTPVVASRVFASMIQDLATSLAVAGILVFAVIALHLRSFSLGLASILPNAFPLLVAGMAIYWTTGYLTLTNTLTFCLCLGIAVDDTIHFLKQYRDCAREGMSPHRAVIVSLRRVGRVLLLSSVILAAGMGSMMVSDMPPLQIFSALAMLAILSALVGDLLVLPATLLLATPRLRGSSD